MGLAQAIPSAIRTFLNQDSPDLMEKAAKADDASVIGEGGARHAAGREKS